MRSFLLATVFLFFALLSSAQNINFGPPAYTPQQLAACQGYAFSQTQTAQFNWSSQCPSGAVVSNGTVAGQGTGYCPGIYGPSGFCVGSNNQWRDPHFSPGAAPSGDHVHINIYIQTDNVTGPGPNNQGCGTPAIQQVPQPFVQTAVVNCNQQPPPCINPNCLPSPIVIDPTGEGFHLTDATHGVLFREHDGDPPVQMSWTDPAYSDAWLVRPNPDGSVTSLAGNMFGNLAPQPTSKDPNGYLALAAAAKTAGCNVSTTLDANTCPQLWSQLRLWHDQNQDGIAQPTELKTLDQEEVHEISLAFHSSPFTDQYGNQFRYVAGIQDAAGPRSRRCYDVFLMTR